MSEKEIIKIITPGKFSKFFVDKDTTKISLSFQLASISGNLPKLNDKQFYNLSLTKIGEKRKREKPKPIETIIILAQQSFEIVSRLNPVQIEIDDDRILNKLKNIKMGDIDYLQHL